MKTRHMMLVSVLLVAAVLLTACPAQTATPAPTQPPAPQATEPPAPQATEPPAPTEPAMEEVSFELWSQEGESEGVFQEIEALAEEYMAEHPNVTIAVVQKDTEALREDFQTASLAGAAPQLLWTVNDHAGVFVVADLIQPVDDLVDLDQFVDSALAAVELEGPHWGVPISNGNHLMLLYNKDLLAEAPADTDEMIAEGREVTSGDVYGLVYTSFFFKQKTAYEIAPVCESNSLHQFAFFLGRPLGFASGSGRGCFFTSSSRASIMSSQPTSASSCITVLSNKRMRASWVLGSACWRWVVTACRS